MPLKINNCTATNVGTFMEFNGKKIDLKCDGCGENRPTSISVIDGKVVMTCECGHVREERA